MEVFTTKFQLFSLLFARTLAAFALAPFFGGTSLSTFYRISLAFFISLLVTPIVKIPPEGLLQIEKYYFVILIEQALIGAFLGMALSVIFAAFQTAGEFFSVQMGFGINDVLDPLSQVSLPLMSIFKNLIALYAFFVSASHIHFIDAIVFSYKKLPLFEWNLFQTFIAKTDMLQFFILMLSSLFLVALKIAFPIIGTLILISVTLGILSKAAPQMNLLMLGFPIKIYLGFIVLTFLSPYIVDLMFVQFDILFSHLNSFFDRDLTLQ